MKRLLMPFLVTGLLVLTTRCGSDDPDPETLPQLSISDAKAKEGASATFNVTLSEASSGTVTFKYATSTGTASDADFETVATPVVVTLTPGQTTATISIALADDFADENDEMFKVVLSDPTNAELSDNSTGDGTINDVPKPFEVTAKANGLQWTAAQTGLYIPGVVSGEIMAYGTGDFSDARLRIRVPSTLEPATYSVGAPGTDFTKATALYEPHYISMGGTVDDYQSVQGGEVKVLVVDVNKHFIAGTFNFTVQTKDGNGTLKFTDGVFKVKL